MLSFYVERESRFSDEGEVTKYSSVRNDNYNRDFICEVRHVNEHSFLAIYLTTVKGVSAGMTGAIIGTSALVGVLLVLSEGIYQIDLAGKRLCSL